MAVTPTTTTSFTAPNLSNGSDAYITGLLSTSGTKWKPGDSGTVTLTYSFPQLATDYGRNFNDEKELNTFAALTNPVTQTLITTQILNQFASVANITFRLVTETPTDHADIPIAYSDMKAVTAPGAVAWAYYPGTGTGGDLWIAKSGLNDTFEAGTSAFQTVVHELGHSLGLKHPFDAPAAPLDHQSQSYTVMNYGLYRNEYMILYPNIASDFHPETLMLEDIRALQYLYGANFNAKSGNTTYTWNPSTGAMTTTDTALDGTSTTSTITPYINNILMTVWDGGGTDTYDFSNYTTGVNVNLQPGAWTTTAANQLPSYNVHFGPPAAAPGNIANAYLYVNPTTGVADLRSLIENAIGGSGDDVIIGNQTTNKLIGNAGDDKLYGLEGADTLEGGEGKDSLYGGDDADTLDGGAGDDLLRGGAGDDTYKFGVGSGKDVIIQGDGGADKLVFDANIRASDIGWTRSGFDLIATLNGRTDQVTLKDWYWGAANQLKVYVEGAELTQLGQQAAAFTDPSVATWSTPAGGGTVTAGSVRALITGSVYNDTLNGGAADDTLVGGAGRDALNGGGGNDLYVFNRGDGADTISDSGGLDTLSFGYGVSASDLSISMSGSNIIVGVRNPASPTTTFANLTDKITIQNWMNAAQRIETFVFADGTSLDVSGIASRLGTDGADMIDLSSLGIAVQLNSGAGNDTVTGGAFADTINGGDGDDVIMGGGGNDTLLGGGGNDTYVYNIGDGKDWIYDYYVTSADASGGTDTLSFGAGIAITDLLISMRNTSDQSVKNLIIGLKDRANPQKLIDDLSDTITIVDWLTLNHRIESFKIGGVIYTAAQLLSYMGTDGDDVLAWTESAVTLNGGKGNDRLTTGNKNDSLFGGDGDDTLDGGGATGGLIDTLRGGAGDDLYLFSKGYGKVLIIQGDGGADQLQFRAGISGDRVTWRQSGNDLIGTLMDSASDEITIQNYYLGGLGRLHYFFTIQSGSIASNITGSSFDDSISGSQFGDTINGGDGNDTLDGGNGNDTMSGGKGDNVYYVGLSRTVIADDESQSDIVIENADSGTDTVYSYLDDYTLTANVENLVLINYYPLGGSPSAKGAGNELANTITGNSSSNVLNGMGGNDTLIGGNGNDTLDGGTGDDTAIYSGTISQYSFSRQNDGSLTVTDAISGRDGVDTVKNIEHLRFSDGEISVSAEGIAPSIVVSGPSSIRCSQSNSVKAFTGVSIQDYNKGATETLTIKLTGGGSLSLPTTGLRDLGGGVYTLTGTAAAVTAALKELVFMPPSGTLASGAETTFELSNTSSAYAPAVTNRALKVVIDNNATTLTITGGQSASVAENVSSQTAVYTAHATNSTANAPLTYSITGGADARFLQITNPTDGIVTFKYTPNFESPVDANADHTYEIIVTASDGVYTASKTVIIEVTNVDEAPVFTSRATSSTIENRDMGVYTALANDPEGGAVTYSITGGADARLLQITNGVVTFKTAPDFETPRDANRDNVYQITVSASDGRNSTSIDVAISVTNVVETAFAIYSWNTASAIENTLAPVYRVGGSRADGGASLTYSISGGDDAGLFNIDSEIGDVTFKNAPNYEAPGDKNKDNSYQITVKVSDGLNSLTKNVTIKVMDVADANKPGSDLNADGHSDILLQNTNGACYVWQTGDTGLTITANGFIGGDDGPGAKWQMKATGDFDGDGKSDLLLQYKDTGAVYVWEMNGKTIKAGGFIGGDDGPGAKWQVKATGDFDGDGHSDILMQYADTGACFVWQTGDDGMTVKKYGFIGGEDGPGAKWQVKGTGDFNGDGKSDILLQYADTGACYVWEMGDNGLTIKAGGFVGGSDGPGADWHARA